MMNLAVCVLTYNHSEVMDQLLNLYAKEYSEYGIDIYIYDSSDDNKTKVIIEKLVADGNTNIFYVEIANNVPVDEKYLFVLDRIGLKKDYDYILPIKDRVFYQGNDFFNRLEGVMEKGADVIFLGFDEDRAGIIYPNTKREYGSPVEFFRDYGEITQSWESVIYNCESMIKKANISELKKKYLLSGKCSFNQTLFLFARLSELNNCKICTLSLKRGERLTSALVSSGWRKRIVDIWVRDWMESISRLPAIYDEYKADVIKKQSSSKVLFGSVDTLINMKAMNMLDEETYRYLHNTWDKISYLPQIYLEDIYKDRLELVMSDMIANIIEAFRKEEYVRASEIFMANECLKYAFGENVYELLKECFDIYRYEINMSDNQLIFKGVHTPEEALQRYLAIKNS